MPELPEVEMIRRDLEKSIIGFRICDVKIHDNRVLRDVSPREFIRRITHQTIRKIERYGKALVFGFHKGAYLFARTSI